MGMFCDCRNLSDFDYSEKMEILLDNKLALCEVIMSCNRIGSLDSNIQNEKTYNILNLLNNYKIERIYIMNDPRLL